MSLFGSPNKGARLRQHQLLLETDVWRQSEEFRNSHGGAPSVGVGTSYLCYSYRDGGYSNCDGRYSNCDGIKHDGVTIAKADLFANLKQR